MPFANFRQACRTILVSFEPADLFFSKEKLAIRASPFIDFKNNSSLLSVQMDHCSTCKPKRKLQYCCGSHPETGEVAELELPSGRVAKACPNLSPRGHCQVYETRPEDCASYLCPRLKSMDLHELLGYD